MTIQFIFNESWLFEKDSNHAVKIKQFRKLLMSTIFEDASSNVSSINELSFSYLGDKSAAELAGAAKESASSFFGENYADFCRIVLDGQAEDLPTDRLPFSAPSVNVSEQEDVVPAAVSVEKSVSVMEKINQRICAENFIEFCNETKNLAPAVLENGTQEMFFRQFILFSVNTGGGYHSSLELLSSLLAECGLMKNPASVASVPLPPPTSLSEDSSKFSSVESYVLNALTKPRIISIDLSKWVDHIDAPELRQLLFQAFCSNKNNLIVLRIPFVNEEKRAYIASVLNDVVSIRTIACPPFNDEHLWTLAQRFLKPYHFQLSEDARSAFSSIVAEEKRDGSFYESFTIQKIVGEFVHFAELNNELSSDENGMKLITLDTIRPLVPREIAADQNALASLREMVGMEPIVSQVESILNQILFARRHSSTKSPCMHMCFVGNPGTGKTTVARALGKILHELGLLRVGNFFECHGRDLCGQYVGHTAPKTAAICQRAYGSVLFIDEAYSLSGGGQVDYGHEAIDTLIAEMENHYDDLLVIFAGYSDDMNRMLSDNPGLRSRVPYVLSFENYTAEQLTKIFFSMISEEFSFEKELESRVENYFSSLPKEMITSKEFGNGRFVRNLYERVWGKTINRCGGDAEHPVITVEDFDAAVQSLTPLEAPNVKKPLGFV